MIINEQEVAKEIKMLQKLARKIRKDKGVPRQKYDSSLDKRYVTYLKRANAKGFEIELTEAHFKELSSSTCYYCDDMPTGFDRIDSRRGYLLNNVVPCCYRCNMMKHTMKQCDFIAHIFQIAKIQKERLSR